MGDEREYLVRITGDAGGIVAAGKQGAGALKEVKAEILDGVNPALANLGTKSAEAGKAAEGMEISHRGLRFALRGLGPEAQEAGHALMFGLTNPMLLGVMAMSLAAGKLISDLQKLREAAAARIDLTQFYQLLSTMGQEGMLKAFTEGGVAADEFWAKIDRLSSAQVTLKEKTDDAVEAIKKETDATSKQVGEKEKSELASVDAQEKLGKLTHDQAVEARRAIRDRIEGERASSAAMAEERVIAAREEERKKAEDIVKAGPDVVESKRLAASKAAGDLGAAKGSVSEMEQKLAALNEYNQKYAGQIAAAEAAGKAFTAPGEHGILRDFINMVNSEPGIPVSGQIDKERRLLMSQIEQQKQQGIPRAETAADNAKAELQTAEKRVQDAKELQHSLDREIAKLKEDHARNEQTREAEAERRTATRQAGELGRLADLAKHPEQMAALEAQAAAEWSKLAPRERANRYRPLTGSEQTEASVGALGDVKAAVSTAQAFEAHKQTSAEQQRQLMEVASALAGQQVSFREAVKMMASAGRNITQDVLRLATVMGELATGHSALQGRVASVEAQLRAIKAQHRDTFNQ